MVSAGLIALCVLLFAVYWFAKRIDAKLHHR
jgi:hypothetical protein